MANETKVEHLIIPEVLEDMIRQELPHKLVFGPLVEINNKLEGVPGNVLTIPKWGLLGVAEDVGELEAVPYEKLTTSKTEVTIKKIAKGVHFSDEALLSGYGDPLGEGVSQLTLSIARKIDNDVLDEIKKAKLKYKGSFAVLKEDMKLHQLKIREKKSTKKEIGLFCIVYNFNKYLARLSRKKQGTVLHPLKIA